MSKRSDTAPARSLPDHPNLEYLKNEAKDRLLVLRWTAPETRLADVQFELAQEYGFSSWRALKDGIGQGAGLPRIDAGGPLAAYAGFYRHAPGIIENFVMTVTVESGQLFLQATARPKLALRREPDGWFAMKGLPARYGFSDLKDELAATLYVAVDGRRTALTRIDASTADKEKAANAAAAKDNARSRTQIEVPAERLDHYCGHYLSPLGGAVTVTAEPGRLFVQMSGQPRFEIYPETVTDFFLRVVPGQFSFQLENGVRVVLTVHERGFVTYFYPASEDAVAMATAATVQRRAEQMQPRTLVAIEPQILPRYAGIYRIDERRIMTVTTQDGHLFAQITDQDRYELYPESPQDFFFTVVAAQVSFITDDQKRVSHAVLHQMGREIPLMRMDAPADGSGHG